MIYNSFTPANTLTTAPRGTGAKEMTMETINISYAMNNATSLEDVIELINDGTCEGMEGMEFTSEQLAGQYAQQAAEESGYDVDDAAIEAHLDVLRDAGAVFLFPEAIAYALAIQAAKSDE